MQHRLRGSEQRIDLHALHRPPCQCTPLAALPFSLQAGAQPGAANVAGLTPLLAAAGSGHALALQLLLKQPGHEALLAARDKNGSGPLHFACSAGGEASLIASGHTSGSPSEQSSGCMPAEPGNGIDLPASIQLRNCWLLAACTTAQPWTLFCGAPRRACGVCAAAAGWRLQGCARAQQCRPDAAAAGAQIWRR